MTIVYLIYQIIDPTTEVGMDATLKLLESCKMGDYGYDCNEMLKQMEKWYKKLKSNGCAPANFRRLLVDALGTGQNHSFNQFVERISDEIESGFGSRANITPDQLIVAARSKYNNMTACKV